MSELKVYHCNEWHNEYTEFYLKSEVDKVLAEKDEEIRRLRRALYKKCNTNEKAWMEMERKCLNKAEEYT